MSHKAKKTWASTASTATTQSKPDPNKKSQPSSQLPLNPPLSEPKLGENGPKLLRQKSIAERQQAQQLEVEALKSIYDADMTMIQNAWGGGQKKKGGNKDAPVQHQFRIKLVPHPTGSGEENHCVVSLEVTLNPTHKIPLLQLRKLKGLSDSLLKTLQDLVNEKAKQIANTEHDGMIYEICTLITDFLLEHNTEQVSFYQEMMDREKLAKKEREEWLREQSAADAEKQEKQREDFARLIEAEKKKKDLALQQKKKPTTTTTTSTTPPMATSPPFKPMDSNAQPLSAKKNNNTITTITTTTTTTTSTTNTTQRHCTKTISSCCSYNTCTHPST